MSKRKPKHEDERLVTPLRGQIWKPSAGELADIRDRYVNQGMTAKAIARAYDVSPQTIQRRLRNADIIPVHTAHEHWRPTVDEIRDIAHKYTRLKMSPAAIGRGYGRSPEIIMRVLRDDGVTLRRRRVGRFSPVPLDLNAEALGKKFRVLREAKKISLRDMAKKMGRSLNVVRFHEAGALLLRLDALITAAAVLNVDASRLITVTDAADKPKRS